MITNFNELYQYGVLGMRWGIRRYQPYPKGHKGGKEVGEAAKKRKLTPREKQVNRLKEKRIADEKRREETREEREAVKEDVLRSGTASEIYEYRGELTRPEMERVLYRLNWEQRISQLSESELSAAQNQLKKFIKSIKGANDDVSTLRKSYAEVKSILDLMLLKGE